MGDAARGGPGPAPSRIAELTISLESDSWRNRGRRTHHTADDASAPLIVGEGYWDCFGDSLGVAGAGSLFPKESLVSTLSPFSCCWYIATTSVPSWSAPGRSIAPGGVSSVVPSLRMSRAVPHAAQTSPAAGLPDTFDTLSYGSRPLWTARG